MCGFVGAMRLGGGDARVEESWLNRMRDRLTHRGPDDAGTWVAGHGRVGFGHRRLSIVDLSEAGHQPVGTPDGGSWLAYNGEIYNHEELRPGLEANGAVYKGRSDTETLLWALHQQGADAVKQFDGMFAFAWWSEPDQRLVLTRDRLGIKPCYVAKFGDWLVFGSEIKGLLEHPAATRDVNPAALSHYLTFLTTPAPHTLFQGIYKIPPGHRLIVEGDGTMRLEQWWRPVVDTQAIEPEAAAERLRDMLRGSIGKRMMADVPFGVFLSGGVDSTTNVALMRELAAGPVRTFNVAFRDHAEYNEDAPARFAAQHYQTEHHEVTIGEREAIEFCDDLVHWQDEPLADWVCIPLYFVAKLVRDSGTIVVQVGEGADELFAGYDHYGQTWDRYKTVWRKVAGLPSPLLSAAGALFRTARSGSRWHRRGELFRRAARGEEFFWGGAIAWIDDLKRAVMRPGDAWTPGPCTVPAFDPLPFNTIDSHLVVKGYIDELRHAKPGSDFLQRLIHLEIKHRLPELLLMRVDKMTMANSIEGRVPFLDHHLVEFALSLPSELKVRDGIGKWVLKKAVRGIVPDDVIDRPKQGFGAPVEEWLKGKMGEFALDRFRRSSIRDRGWFDDALIERMLADHRSGRRNCALHIWIMLNLTLWYDRWIAR